MGNILSRSLVGHHYDCVYKVYRTKPFIFLFHIHIFKYVEAEDTVDSLSLCEWTNTSRVKTDSCPHLNMLFPLHFIYISVEMYQNTLRKDHEMMRTSSPHKNKLWGINLKLTFVTESITVSVLSL